MQAVVTVLIVVVALAAFVPFDPLMPALGLDPSWRFAINEATARAGGLVFGSQIVFTLGPYASLYTGEYHPSIALITYGASIWLALAYASAIRMAASRDALLVPVLLCLLISIPASGKDVLLLSSPMLVTIVTFTRLHGHAGPAGKKACVAYAVVCSMSGLLPLIKGTFVVACIASALINGLALTIGRQRVLAVISIGAPVIAALVFWTIAGQPAAQLPTYLALSMRSVSSYTEAMASPGDHREMLAFACVAALLLASIVAHARTAFGLRAFVALSFGLYLFIAFKGGFVRHDEGHSPIVGRSILTAALCVLLALRSVPLCIAAIVASGFWVLIEQRQNDSFASTLATRITQPYRDAWSGLSRRVRDPSWPQSAFDEALAGIRSAYPLPRLDGPTDIYSTNQVNLIAAGNDWSPRPVFQSYAAYDARLLALNARHLVGPGAPTNIVFNVEAIDRRFPALEDGASWPLLIANYHATAMIGDLLVLARNPTDVPTTGTSSTSARHAMGETVELPLPVELLYARFDIEPTLLGTVSALLLKTDVPTIEVRLQDGRTRRYRLLPRMAQSEFLLSPLVEDTDDFARIFRVFDDLPAKRVASFTVTQPSAGPSYWRTDYTVTFVTRAAPAGPGPTTHDLPLHRVSQLNAGDAAQQRAQAGSCEGRVESIDAPKDAAGRYVPGDTLDIKGWIFAGAPAGEVAAVLTDASGRRRFAPLRRTLRADVAKDLRRPELAATGYLGAVALSVPPDDYTLRLAIGVDGAWTLCEPFNRTIRTSAPGPSPG